MSSKMSSYDQSGRSTRPHGRRLLAAVCLAATLTCVPVAAGGQSGNGPGQLWQEFPLEQKQAPPPREQPKPPPPATTPATSTKPAPTTATTPAEPESTPAETVDRASASEVGDGSGGWPIAAKAAIALSGVGLAGFLLLALTSLLGGRRVARRKPASPSPARRPSGEESGSRFQSRGRRPKRQSARHLSRGPTPPQRAEPEDEPEPPTVTEPFAELLVAAQETAEEMRTDATEDAQRIRAQARQEAEALARPRREAEAVRLAELREEAARVRSEADRARARARQAVDAHVEEHRTSVRNRVARLQTEAEAHAEMIRAAAEARAQALDAADANARAAMREQQEAIEVLERALDSLGRSDPSPPEKQPEQSDLGERVRRWTLPSDH